jgi:hypothetical protein
MVLIAAGYLVFENVRLRHQIAQTLAERAALEQREQELRQRLAERRSSDAETANELARVRDRLGQLEQRLVSPEQRREAANEVRNQKLVAFNLSPQARGAGQIAILAVPSDINYVALTLTLEMDDFPAYRAALRDPATSQIVWRSGRLKTSNQSKTVRVGLRAGLLKPQNYVLELSGISATSVADLVSSYPFRVVR